MKRYVFLYRIKDEADRDACAYLENKLNRFVCGHYFSPLGLCGSCYRGGCWEDYADIETILSEDEYAALRKIDDAFGKLGFGIKPGDERYQKGLALTEDLKPIFDKLNSEEADDFFQQIVANEKQIVMREQDLTEAEVEEAFDGYPLDYRDRSIIGAVYEYVEEAGMEEAYELGYVKKGEVSEQYFDFERFGRDLTEGDSFQELTSGRCVRYMM